MLMALWFKFKKFFVRSNSNQKLLTFNQDQLQTRMEDIYHDLYAVKLSDGLRMAIKLIETARNIQLLEMARVKADLGSVAHAQGRMSAFSDLLAAIDLSLDPAFYASRNSVKRPKETKTLIRETQRSTAVI